MAIFLGIDGGATKTSCVIGDENVALGAGSGPGSNVVRVGEARAAEALKSAIGQACQAAKITPSEIARTCIGVAGAARAKIRESVERILQDIVGGEIEVTTDMVVALEAAFGGGPGMVVIAGTGSFAYGANAEGQTARAGGWGFAVSDEGSGYWIGRNAVSAVMRARDENENAGAGLLADILGEWRLKDFDELVLAANASPAPDFAQLFPAVLAASEVGDVVAREVLRKAGAELARLTKIVAVRLFDQEVSVPVAMSGGVFANSRLVREAFVERLNVECPQAVVRPGIVQPVDGALARARRG